MSRVDRLICHVMPKAFLMALTADGRLVELQVVRRDRPSRVDSIFLGRLERVVPELDAAFVDIGLGRSGFLRTEDRAGLDDWPPAGAPLLVQLRHEGDGEKGPRLTMDLAVSGRYVVYHPPGSGVGFSRRIDGESERERLAGHVSGLLEGGAVLRTAAAGATAELLQADVGHVLERWEKLRAQAFANRPPADLSAHVPGERDPIARTLRDHGAALEEVILDDRAMNERARELFAELKSETLPAEKVRMMSGGQRQAVAIARTHLSRAKIVLMDEPTAAISVRQVAEVLDLLRRLREQGMAVVLISHRMPDVFGVDDRIVVLRRGHKVADKPTRESSPEEVTGLITGAIRVA